MPARQTRKKSTMASAADVSSGDDRDAKLVNGNGAAYSSPEASDAEPRENIFLFWPNIIGTISPGRIVCHTSLLRID